MPWRCERLKNGRAHLRPSNRPDISILAIQGFSHRVYEPLSLRAVVAPVSRQPDDIVATPLLARFPFLYRLIAGIPVASQNLLAPLQCHRGGCGYVRVFLGIGNVVTDFVMDESLDDIFLVSARDYPTDLRVIWLRPEVPGISLIAAVFEGNKVVFLIAGWVVGMRHAPGGINLPRFWIDELRPCLMHSVPVFPKLFPFQLARVLRWRPDLLRAPVAVADVILDVLLGDIRVRSTRRPNRVRIDFRRANAAGLSPSPMRQEDAG